VDTPHEPARFVGTNRQHHQIECAETCPDFRECGMQRGVSREKDARAIGVNDPAAPQRVVAIADPPGAEMLRRRARGAEGWCLERLPPVTFDDVPDTKGLQQWAQSQRAEPWRIGEAAGDAADRGRIEMVVVIVREQDNVEWRKSVEVQPRRHQATRTEPLQRRRTFAPDGIRQDVHWPELQQCGRVADPRHCSIAVLCTR
jgi:hypothetical protein